VFVVPVQVVGALAQRGALGGRGLFEILNDPSVAQAAAGNQPGSAVPALVAAFASLLVLPFVAGAISRVVAASYLGEDLPVGPALRAAGRRWWALVIAWFVVHVVELVTGVLCILPGLLAMVTFVAVAPAIVVEELGPFGGMRRSFRLLWPR